MGLREQILEADDHQREQVTVPEWKATFWIRTLSAKELDEFQLNNTIRKGKDRGKFRPNLRARALAISAVDEQGQPIFSEADVIALGKKSGAVLDRIFAVFGRLNHMEETDEGEEKNSAETPGSASPTG